MSLTLRRARSSLYKVTHRRLPPPLPPCAVLTLIPLGQAFSISAITISFPLKSQLVLRVCGFTGVFIPVRRIRVDGAQKPFTIYMILPL